MVGLAVIIFYFKLYRMEIQKISETRFKPICNLLVVLKRFFLVISFILRSAGIAMFTVNTLLEGGMETRSVTSCTAFANMVESASLRKEVIKEVRGKSN